MNRFTRRRTRRAQRGRTQERGAALITSILCMTLLYALGLALLLSTTTDVLVSSNYRSSEEAFFAADAGVAIGRKAISRAIAEKIADVAAGRTRAYRPDSQILPDSASAPSSEFFTAVTARAAEIANEKERSKLPNKSRYNIEIIDLSGGPATQPVRNPRNGLESYVYSYAIKSTGHSQFGARAEVVERGQIQTQLTASFSITRQPYSKYGTFFDKGDPSGGLVLVSGTFTGPVHTNSHFNYSSKNTVIFRGRVTQGDPEIVYDGQSAPIPENGAKGIVVSPGAYQKDARVPLPKNNFQQELAVVNGSGYAGSGTDMLNAEGRVKPDVLAENLADAKGQPAQATQRGVAPGVYVSSNEGSSITGGGIYVSGDAQIQLTTDGGTQVIRVTQGSQTSTVSIDYQNQTTTLTSGGSTRVFTGVPMDNSLGSGQSKPAVSLFVDGSITSMSGPPANDGQTGAAIAPQTAMTVTAQRNITITGDIKYTDPVVGADGSPVPHVNQNQAVLGIFTNDGNVILQPDDALTDGNGKSLEIDAAIAAFNSNTSNDGGKIEGAILFGDGSPKPGASLRIVGARIQSNIGNIKYRKRSIYHDPRLEGGQFAPPFYPGIDIKADPTELKINFAGEQAVVVYADAWQRDERRRKKSSR